MRYKNFEFEFYNRQSCKKQTRHSYRIFHEIVGSDVVALVSQQKSGISTRTATKNMLSAVFPMIVLRELGSLYYCPRVNLSLYTGIYYSGFVAHNKKIRAFREVFPSETCPICPLFSVRKCRNPLIRKSL